MKQSAVDERMKNSVSVFLDFSRWSAAFLVILGHAAHFLAAGFDREQDMSVALGVAYFVTNLGHAAVIVFFVISGYLVGGITCNRWMKSGPDVMEYAISRFSRIYTVLVPALIVGYALDAAGMHWLDGNGLYSNVGAYPIGSLDAVEVRLSPLVFIGNLLMMQTVHVTSLGSNGPLWSLAYEWWYYVVFCLVLMGALYRGRARIAAVVLLGALAIILPSAMFLWMVIWLLGTATFFLCKSGRLRPHPALAAAVFLATLVGTYQLEALHIVDRSRTTSFLMDLAVAASYCLLLLSVARDDFRLPMERFHRWAAGFSYSMYLFHFPTMLLLVALANEYAGWTLLSPFSPTVCLRIGLLVAMVYVLGYGFSMLTERYTDEIRRSLRRAVRSFAISRVQGGPEPD